MTASEIVGPGHPDLAGARLPIAIQQLPSLSPIQQLPSLPRPRSSRPVAGRTGDISPITGLSPNSKCQLTIAPPSVSFAIVVAVLN